MTARVRTLVAALTAALALGVVPAVASPAGAATAPVPATEWAASFCQAYGPYITAGFAAQQALDAAGTATNADAKARAQAVVARMRKAATSATNAAKATTADGVPDVKNGAAIARALATLFRGSAKVFTDAAKTAATFPTSAEKLAKAAKATGGDIAKRLDALSTSSKIAKLDAKGAVQQAVTADATCAAAITSTRATP
jgi:hypothetical protein